MDYPQPMIQWSFKEEIGYGYLRLELNGSLRVSWHCNLLYRTLFENYLLKSVVRRAETGGCYGFWNTTTSLARPGHLFIA